jgi:3-oxoacyl-[acyl-carrier-protein] synthase II
MKRRVVVTGLGVIAPNGIGKDEFWNSLRTGKSGIKRISRFDSSGYPCQVAGEVDNFDPTDYMEPKTSRRMDRFSHFALSCAKMAMDDAGLEIREKDNGKIGVVSGSALGGMPYAESQHAIFLEKGLKRIDPLLAIKLFPGESASRISIEFNIKGPVYTLSTACAAGADAIGLGLSMIQNGTIDAAIVGGAEAPLAPMTFGAFCNVGALTKANYDPQKACKPFDIERDGFIMSEGAGFLIIEELGRAINRNAPIYVELMGYGASSDAYHMTRNNPDGDEAVKAIKVALHEAGIDPESIEYVNAHGSATLLNDEVETIIIKKVFDNYAYKLPISSTKSMTGHALGAAGAIELIASILTIKSKFIPPTINYKHPDPQCDLDYVPNEGIEKSVQTVLSNSFAFGARNAAVVIQNYNGASF